MEISNFNYAHFKLYGIKKENGIIGDLDEYWGVGTNLDLEQSEGDQIWRIRMTLAPVAGGKH
ncbi:hypothetical protein E2C01_092556 [Portunus trituberculatus]|uniref:Uncharacterized protein n=1 Tax=Portunus trituberculatus TaxID=210409 RepID=A0A5B7JMA6_PORTR|nr:hypothetical protein [Portunus trituberculatus]